MDHASASRLILPDSRLRDRMKGVVRGLLKGFGAINWVPIYCANCGKPNGHVAEENCNFVCWLCTPCSETYGAQFGEGLIPDEVFWSKVRDEQLEKYGRVLTPAEIQTVADSGCSPLSTLLRERRT